MSVMEPKPTGDMEIYAVLIGMAVVIVILWMFGVVH